MQSDVYLEVRNHKQTHTYTVYLSLSFISHFHLGKVALMLILVFLMTPVTLLFLFGGLSDFDKNGLHHA